MSEGVAHRFPERPRTERGEKSQMPDFDTRRPQEPDRPSRLHMFVVGRWKVMQHISAVGRWKDRAMMRHWRLWLRVSLLAVSAGGLTAWAVEPHIEQVDEKLDWAVETPSEQVGREIKAPPTPAYNHYYEASTLSGGSSAECDLSKIGHYEAYACHDVITKVTDPAELASITQELKADPDGGMGGAEVMQVEFFKPKQGWGDYGNLYARSYCFDFEFDAAD